MSKAFSQNLTLKEASEAVERKAKDPQKIKTSNWEISSFFR